MHKGKIHRLYNNFLIYYIIMKNGKLTKINKSNKSKINKSKMNKSTKSRKRGGMIVFTPNTTKNTKPILLGISELSRKVQWLIDLAGSDNVIEALTDYFCETKKNKPSIVYKKNFDKKEKNTIVFKSGMDQSVGHWIYFNSKGVKMDPYELGHQKNGTNQFCQTFAIIYMLSDGCDFGKIYIDKLKAGENQFGNNIRVIISFWQYIFHYQLSLTNWLIEEVRAINNDFLSEDPTLAITKNTDDININFIDEKLLDIDIYADQIAKIVH